MKGPNALHSLLDKHRPGRAVITTHRVRYRPALRARIVLVHKDEARERPHFFSGTAAPRGTP